MHALAHHSLIHDDAGVEGNAVSKVTQLWNPRGNHGLRRYWISFEDQIVIADNWGKPLIRSQVSV